MRRLVRFFWMALALSSTAAPGHASLLFADVASFVDVHLAAPGTLVGVYVSGVVCPSATGRTDLIGTDAGVWCTNPDGSWTAFQSFPPDLELTDFGLMSIGALDFGFDPGGGGGDNGGGGAPGGGGVTCDLFSYQYVDPNGACPSNPGPGGSNYDLVSRDINGPQYYYGVAGPGFNIGEVVGTFSTNPSYSDFVGIRNFYSFVVPNGVTDLYLIVNDGYRADNTGAYEVLVTPEPDSSALLGSGLIGFALWMRRRRAQPRRSGKAL
jgi:hypothetical protein